MITAQEINTRLQQLVAEYVNRGYKARDAVSKAIKALADWASANGVPAEIRIDADQFEVLVAQVEQMIERFRAEQERGAVPAGGGVYVEPMDQDEFDEKINKPS